MLAWAAFDRDEGSGLCAGPCCRCMQTRLVGRDELTRVEKPLVEVPQVREELSVNFVELLGERAAKVSNVLMNSPFMAVLR